MYSHTTYISTEAQTKRLQNNNTLQITEFNHVTFNFSVKRRHGITTVHVTFHMLYEVMHSSAIYILCLNKF